MFEEEEFSGNIEPASVNSEVKDNEKGKVNQEQIHGLLFGDKLSWQAIIYDLINTEQLNPWDIDISLLSNKFLEKVRELEEANFFVSSKVLFAAALLLRIKSEVLLNYHLPSLDDILFGKKEEKHVIQERLELDEDVPDLVPRTPLPRFRKVTLQELMESLGKAIQTENRRIKRVVVQKQYEMETQVAMPKRRINIRDEIRGVYAKLRELFLKRETRISFSELAGKDKEERVATFVPLLHLENQKKVFMEQEGHFEEIWILLQHLYEKQNSKILEEMRKEVDEAMKNDFENLDSEEKRRAEKLEEEFENPIGDLMEEETEG